MADHFAVRVGVRSYEVDVNGHVNHANYHRYAEHARTEHLSAAGCSMFRLVEHGMGIVLLETTCRFLRELRYADEVEIDSRLSFGAGRTFGMQHTLRRVADGEPAAEISCRPPGAAAGAGHEPRAARPPMIRAFGAGATDPSHRHRGSRSCLEMGRVPPYHLL